MFIKTRYIVALVIFLVVTMAVKWQFVAFMAESRAVHGYHGLCNGGIGEPYADFVHRLRLLSESGDTNTLARVLKRADQRSRDIYEVWLAPEPDAYRKSINEIFE